MTDLLIGGIAGLTSRTLTAPLELNKLHKQNPFMPHSNWREVVRLEGIRGLWKGNVINGARIFPQMSINYYFYHRTKKHLWVPVYEKVYHTTPVSKAYSEKHPIIHLLSGATAGVISTCVIYPLETIRSRLSLQINHNHYSGVVDSFKQISIRDLYKGFGVSICGFVPFNAISFSIYNYLKNKADDFENENNTSSSPSSSPFTSWIKTYPSCTQLLCGGFAGVGALTITYPTDLIRKRMQLQNFDSNVPVYKSARDCLRKMYLCEGGIRGVYCGLGASYVKLFPALAIQFYTMETLRTYFGNKE